MSGYGFSPDLSSLTPGVITDGNNFLPTRRGLRSLPTMIQASTMPFGPGMAKWGYLYDTGLGVMEFIWQESDGDIYASRGFSLSTVATPSTDITDVVQFGSVLVAATISGGLMVRASTMSSLPDASVPFVAIPNSPGAQILFAVGGMLIAARGALAGQANGQEFWFTSNEHDYNGWIPSSLSTPSNSVAAWGPLYSPAGPITAGGALGHRAVIYKAGSTWVGQYTGPVDKWLFDCVDESVGCASKGSLVIARGRHWFLGADDFYAFDGSRPIGIGAKMREWLMDITDRASVASVSGAYDPDHDCIVWTFLPRGATSGRIGVAYNVGTGEWGRADHDCTFAKVGQWVRAQAAGNMLNRGSVELGLIGLCSNGAIGLACDTVWSVTGDSAPVSESGHKTSWIETGDIGDEEETLSMTRARVRFEEKPAACTGTHYFRDEFSADRHAKSLPINLNKDRLDSAQSAKFHRVRLDMQGQWDMESINLMPPKGKR